MIIIVYCEIVAGIFIKEIKITNLTDNQFLTTKVLFLFQP